MKKHEKIKSSSKQSQAEATLKSKNNIKKDFDKAWEDDRL